MKKQVTREQFKETCKVGREVVSVGRKYHTLGVFNDFKVDAEVVGEFTSSKFTTTLVKLKGNTKISKIESLSKEIALAFGVEKIRVIPIPHRNLIGIEAPVDNPVSLTFMNDAMKSDKFVELMEGEKEPLTFIVGEDSSGELVTCDLVKNKNLLIAGGAGSGKSVVINNLILNLITKINYYKDYKLMLVDPKEVELSEYEGVKNLICPVIKETDDAIRALEWMIGHMNERYETFSKHGVRDISEYNKLPNVQKMERIVIVIDELSDLMMESKGEIEKPLIRLLQKGRASGIQFVIATQRPDSKVITGLIKVNIQTQIALTVPTAVNSRIILDMGGAEKLCGEGDMLFKTEKMLEPKRLQGIYAPTAEVKAVVQFIKDKMGLPAFNNDLCNYVFGRVQFLSKDKYPELNEAFSSMEHVDDMMKWFALCCFLANAEEFQAHCVKSFSEDVRFFERLCGSGVNLKMPDAEHNEPWGEWAEVWRKLRRITLQF